MGRSNRQKGEQVMTAIISKMNFYNPQSSITPDDNHHGIKPCS